MIQKSHIQVNGTPWCEYDLPKGKAAKLFDAGHHIICQNSHEKNIEAIKILKEQFGIDATLVDGRCTASDNW